MRISSAKKFITAKIWGVIQYFTIKDTNRPPNIKYLYIDITELHLKDSQTGIQRVTKNILSILKAKTLPYKIKEIYAIAHGGGFYDAATNQPIHVIKDDIFFGLDLSVHCIQMNKILLKKMHTIGVHIWFFIHDMIPIYFPKTVEKGIRTVYPKWLTTITSSATGIIGNSKATITDYATWGQKNYPKKLNSLILSYTHLGTNFFLRNPEIFCTNTEAPIFLMVGTIEPRKMYEQCIKAFSLLWKHNYNITLQIVGKRGWDVDSTIAMINEHPQLNKKLFWFGSGISDEHLLRLYSECNAVIFASVAEGFGLPIIEAASYNKPLILRDIPIFREVAQNGAFYFNGETPEALADAIKQWLTLYESSKVLMPQINTISWETCTNNILQIMGISYT